MSGKEKNGHSVLYFVKVNMKAVNSCERRKLEYDLSCLFLVILLILN